MAHVIELGPGHYCLDQNDSDVQKIAQSIPWYGPKYSPHDVPAFYDISGVIENPPIFKTVITLFVQRYRTAGTKGPTHVIGIDARGFIFGPPIALALGIPFVMLRKSGKAPGVLITAGAYESEYARDEVNLRLGAVKAGDRVLLIDDLVATGGSALAGFDLIDATGASVYEFAALVALPGLNGLANIHKHRDGKFKDVPVFTMIDDRTIGDKMCRDPPADTPQKVPAAEAVAWAAKLGL